MPTLEPYRDKDVPERLLRWIEVLRRTIRPIPQELVGNGSPEGVLTATIRTRYYNQTGAAGTRLYVKTTNTGNTGWEAYG